MRCKNYRVRERSCQFRCKIRNVCGMERTDEDYWKLSNLEIVPFEQAKAHCCTPSDPDTEGENTFRMFCKDQMKLGERNFDNIKAKAGIAVKYKNRAPAIFGDNYGYIRTINYQKQKLLKADIPEFDDSGIPQHLRVFTELNGNNEEIEIQFFSCWQFQLLLLHL